MWSKLAADARLSSRLRWPDRDSSLRRVLIWLCSRGLLVLALQRVSHRYMERRVQYGWTLGLILTRLLLALTRMPIMMITRCDVGDTVDIAPGVYLSDCGFLILGMASIGSQTLIHERVTIGPRAADGAKPVIGANVWVGPDCVIYGDLGDGATVLPGSVVSIGVPAGAVAAGNPATIIRRQFDNAALRRSLARDVTTASLVSA